MKKVVGFFQRLFQKKRKYIDFETKKRLISVSIEECIDMRDCMYYISAIKKEVFFKNILLCFYMNTDVAQIEDSEIVEISFKNKQIVKFLSSKYMSEDYVTFKELVCETLIEEVQVRNDPVKRFTELISMQTNPENFKAAVSELKKKADEVQSRGNNRKR
jgi:hypothetical protein